MIYMKKQLLNSTEVFNSKKKKKEKKEKERKKKKNSMFLDKNKIGQGKYFQKIIWQCLSKWQIRDFPCGAVVKNPPANAEDTGSSPGLGRSHMPQSN